MTETRMTSQRLKIMGYLKGVRSHPTAEEVYIEVKKDLPAITLATVYRNLNLLTKQGKILRIKVKGGYRFDAIVSAHQHCICKKCGEITDIFQEKISNYAMKKIETEHFRPTSVLIIFRGICKDCQD